MSSAGIVGLGLCGLVLFGLSMKEQMDYLKHHKGSMETPFIGDEGQI